MWLWFTYGLQMNADRCTTDNGEVVTGTIKEADNISNGVVSMCNCSQAHTLHQRITQHASRVCTIDTVYKDS